MSASATDDPAAAMWVRGPVEARLQPQEPAARQVSVPGLDREQTHVPRPRPERAYTQRPRPEQTLTPGIGWVNAHGGAGTSTLAKVFGGVDVGQAWPDVSEGQPSRIMLVARTHAAGLQAASRVMDALRAGQHPVDIQLLALVLVADAPGRLPAVLSRRVRVLRSAARTFSVPWIPAWRQGEPEKKVSKELIELRQFISPLLAVGERF